jgi:hypothetical protein
MNGGNSQPSINTRTGSPASSLSKSRFKAAHLHPHGSRRLRPGCGSALKPLSAVVNRGPALCHRRAPASRLPSGRPGAADPDFPARVQPDCVRGSIPQAPTGRRLPHRTAARQLPRPAAREAGLPPTGGAFPAATGARLAASSRGRDRARSRRRSRWSGPARQSARGSGPWPRRKPPAGPGRPDAQRHSGRTGRRTAGIQGPSWRRRTIGARRQAMRSSRTKACSDAASPKPDAICRSGSSG